ncbi:hypothetical protein TGPRC2_266050 [Toxoplasma gondii TgCatPRC2]|uniref:Uncharacterized protein n=10 Tax=Toxoplasma gondii TaxID=5811 RepID=B9Q1A9_TOXGV|nr:hypothetical protein TGME49_266050 [Toxoplasma gondii ME49]EPR57299.1 hypothetical protein TGGT1_266050 [Toxoplasma gondii GT1]ESS33544.1 hypothetical protein TGVEG_266050 [Toxoplasma gondii VEG]KAF4644184.1 hypothetical protein TGRH88_011760 [Toxoplasma gondii]KFG38655.1 hypothetical protein TGDOM2_266050 [Toxoplasma gondii GAB2-2007-GAL-DOM2]KFG41882.1 hypothetical protein TGFOU_266050 [Toxoplasma gondii FOU]KFG56964.1 hypothetical protein TGRUB_266050 [Toxoplasma gondii RUB]KYF45482.1 |eukprot:XP_002368704.1 hypothetical protein TGME49_266050 [Toxoplasma gondii ME49]
MVMWKSGSLRVLRGIGCETYRVSCAGVASLLFAVSLAILSGNTVAFASVNWDNYALDDIVYEVVYPEDYSSLASAVRHAAWNSPAPHMVPVSSCEATVIPLPPALLDSVTALEDASSFEQDTEEPSSSKGPRCECQVQVSVLFDIGERAEEIQGNGNITLSGCFRVRKDDTVEQATMKGTMKARCQEMFNTLPLAQMCGNGGKSEELRARMSFFSDGEVQGPPDMGFLELEAPVSGQAPLSAFLAVDASATEKGD